MTDDMGFWGLVALVLLCLVISVVALLAQRRTKEQLMKSIGLLGDLHQANERTKAKLHGFEKFQAQSQKDMQDINASVNKIKETLSLCEDNIDRLFEQDPALKMYSKASKLVAAGESIEDIIEASGLPRAEVEVLIALHRK